MRLRGGFTLIELLVVVAIIALLITILLPTLEKARGQAKMAVCAANLRQVGVAWMVYLGDSDDWFLPYGKTVQHATWLYGGKHPSIGEVLHWRHRLTDRPLNPYVQLSKKWEQAADVFHCPADRPIPPLEPHECPLPGTYFCEPSSKDVPSFDYYGNNYFVNHHVLGENDPTLTDGGGDPPDLDLPVRITDIDLDHGHVLLAGDQQWYFNIFATGAWSFPWDADFHSNDDIVNMLFLDGHVSFTRSIRGEPYTGTYSILPRSYQVQGYLEARREYEAALEEQSMQ